MTSHAGRTALVTGGHGFLGSHLVDLLLRRGFTVRCLLRPERSEKAFQDRPVEVARGDLRGRAGLAEAAAGMDYVFHVAGLIAARGPAQFRAVNVEGTRRLAEAVASANSGCRRFVYVSSQAAAGPSPDGVPITEERAPVPVSHYGRSKLGGERVLPRALGPVPFTILRPPAIYGPRDEAILPFFKAASLGIAIGLEGRGRRFNLLHASDVAEGLLAGALGGEAAGRTYFLADATGYEYKTLNETMARALGRRLRRIPVPDLLVDAAAVVTEELAATFGAMPVFGRQKAIELKTRWWLCSAEAARRDLGWRPRVDLETGLRETAWWYARAGRLRSAPRAPSPL